MTPERWREVTQIYGAVVSRAPEQRAAAVAELCGTDENLRREIEALLESQHGASLLDRPASDRGSVMQMVLPVGSQIGVFRIESLLGVGGMGEVYRARDTKLNRDVAIKILPPVFANDPDRLARFKREAQLLASLNHPRIAAIYGFEDSSSVHALVLELVEGPTLADLISGSRPLPIDDVFSIAIQIAEALEAAHEKGIVHRDLKPGNVKLTKDHAVKVLDFGLAKAFDGDAVNVNVSQSPTLSMRATQAGVILGTAAYMAPEQARGLGADHRSDVFSFGVVLYEMLTGRQPFPGETIPDVLASILARDPDLSTLPANLNPRLIELIRRCLDKNPKRRWQAIGDVRAELETIAVSPIVSASQPAARPADSVWRTAGTVIATAVVSLSLAAYVTWKLKPTERPSVVRFTAPLARGQQFTAGRRGIAISPDGRQIVYVANRQLFLRQLSQAAPMPLKGTEAPSSVSRPSALQLNSPAFSPDGQFVAYYNGGAIRKVAVSGGTPMTLCATGNVLGLWWDSSGIIFSEGNTIKRVAEGGGQPQVLFTLTQNIATDVQLLPDGRTLLLAVAADIAGTKSHIVAQPWPSGDPKVVVEDGSGPRYLPSGELIFARDAVLLGARFDPRTLALLSEPVPLVEGVLRSTGGVGLGTSQFAVADVGSLAYIRGPVSVSESQRGLALIDLKGNRQILDVPPAAYNFPRVSPDSNWLAVDVDDGDDSSIYVYRLSGGSQIRRLTQVGHNRFPIWSADSRSLTFQSDVDGKPGLFQQRADGTEPPRQLTKPVAAAHVPETWSPDGKTLLFSVVRDGVYELQTYSVDTKRFEPFADVKSIYPPGSSFSRDGRLVAYFQRKPGDNTGSLFVRAFPNGPRYEVVKGGGLHPIVLNGSEPFRLLYTLPNQRQLVDITLHPDFGLSAAVEARLGPMTDIPAAPRHMDVVGKGDQFVIVSRDQSVTDDSTAGEPAIEVALNWLEDVKARMQGQK